VRQSEIARYVDTLPTASFRLPRRRNRAA
jgi:hypothetical protein